ncbi:MAG: S8 family serine peptidase [Phycisphaerales bacterium]
MQRKTPTFALSLILLAGSGAGLAHASDGPTPAVAAAQSLNLQPGDAELIADAIGNPIEFREVKGEREFTGELIVHAKRGKVPTAGARVANLTLRESAFVPERIVKVPAGMTEGQLAAILMATGDYEFAEPNWTLFPAIVPNDSQYGSSWQHNRLESAAAWDIETGGSNIIVAVCDSGVDLDHPDLQDALVPGFNSPSNRAQVDGGDVDDVNGHGTFVAGCAAAQGNNNRGVVGVGWDFSIMPIRVSNNSAGTASAFAILEGARWAAENGAHVINASFTGGTASANQSTARYLKEQGALLFWASGNAGSFIEPNRPDYVIVGSTTSSDNRSGFSNYGPAVDVTAPGSSVRSTRRGGSYGNGSGTSYASPIAAGVGAMIFSVNPDFNPDDVQHILYNSVDDLGASGRDDFFGRGRVDTLKAVQMAQSYVRPAVLPVNTGFESAAWLDLFSTTSGSPELVSVPEAPEGSSVVRFGAGDQIATQALAGRTIYDDAMISFVMRAEDLEPGDALLVQYLQDPETSGDDSWATIVTIDERGLVNDEFVRYNIELAGELQWHGVQIRFLAQGDDASDAWMLDDFSLDVVPALSEALEDNFEGGTLDPVKWLITTNTDAVYDSGTFAAELSNNAFFRSHDIPLLQYGFVQSYLRFDAWKNAEVESSDVLEVEINTVSGDWETIATLTGSDLQGSPELFQFDLPIYAWAINDAQVRFTTSTAGAFLIDDVYLGTEALAAGCSDADLAEPYGELNFFDVSSFLSAYNAQDPAADFNGDGSFDFFDVSSFLTLFNAGCP